MSIQLASSRTALAMQARGAATVLILMSAAAASAASANTLSASPNTGRTALTSGAPGAVAGRMHGGMRRRANPDGLSFGNYSLPSNGVIGAYPTASLVDVGGVLYGTASAGGWNNSGSVFSISRTMAPTSVAVLHNFGQVSPDGTAPAAALVSRGAWLYGTTKIGGAQGAGGVYRLNPASPPSFSYTFGDFGSNPGTSASSLTYAFGKFWGTTLAGGNGYGTIFDFTNLNNIHICYTFNGVDGTDASGGLIKAGTYLYGTTEYGGANNIGTVFKIHPNCSGAPTEYHFGSQPSDGASPNGGLIQVGNKLYGTTSAGGAGYGTIIQVSTTGSLTETPIYSFTPAGTNGTTPFGALVFNSSENALYGTTSTGGGSTNCSGGCGTVFKYVLPNGPYSTVHSFQGTDGATPLAGLLMDPYGGYYGTTRAGGTFNLGTVFDLVCASCQ